MNLADSIGLKKSEGYVRCLNKVIDRTHHLLADHAVAEDYGKIHSVKSVLYAAMERAWLESERIRGVQQMLQELLLLTTEQIDLKPEDRDRALRLLHRLHSYHSSH